MKLLQPLLCSVVIGLSVLGTDAFAQRRGGGGGRPRPQFNPAPQIQPGARLPEVRVPGVNGGVNLNSGVRVNDGAARVGIGGAAGTSVRPAGVNLSGNVNAAANHAIYRNNITIGQRTFNVAPNTYRPSYQNYPWHRGYWNNTYGWNPQIGFGRGYYGNYGGYGVRLGNIYFGTGGYGGIGGYGYGRYPLGWGYGGWGLGSMLYGSGYMPYYNPYWGGGIGGANYAYNYAQPVYVTTAATATSEVASNDFDSAREAFRAGDYATALTLVNRAIQENPSDGVLHEFRALVLFAQKDYAGAAATIHSVLAVGPGWDWGTMASLYASVDDYTAQLRALESFTKSNPSDAASQFLLGYHYLTTGHPEHAAKEFSSVVKLQPKDQVAKDLLNLVNKPKEGDAVAAPAPREESSPTPKPDENVRPINVSTIVGQWKASREDGSKFGLDLRNDKTFTWKYDQGDRHENFSGTYTTEGSLLLLQKQDGGSMIGHVAQDGEGKFIFKLLGAPADDPGLSFSH